MADPSILIIGAGTFGTSIAYHLSQKYKDTSKVTVLDRSLDSAAAIDVNRVIRPDYTRSLYCNLAFRALHDWVWKLELQRFFHHVGWLYLNEGGSDVSASVKETFRARGSNQIVDVPLAELESKWDGVLRGTETDGFSDAYFNRSAGWCNARDATASLMKAAIERGVRRVDGQVTELLFDEESGIKGARTADGQTYTADKIVLATGAWTSTLLSPIEDTLSIPSQDRIERQIRATGGVTAYYAISEEDAKYLEASKMPVVVYGERGEVIPPSPENKLVKYSNTKGTFSNFTTTKTGHKISMPRAESFDDQLNVPEKLKKETEELMMSRVVPGLAADKKPEYWRICWDAVTPTEDWLLCRHPHDKLKDLYIATGGSFHSYKFLPVAGEFMLNVLNGKSNGEEKDKAWGWKKDVVWEETQQKKARAPTRELKDLEKGAGRQFKL